MTAWLVSILFLLSIVSGSWLRSDSTTANSGPAGLTLSDFAVMVLAPTAVLTALVLCAAGFCAKSLRPNKEQQNTSLPKVGSWIHPDSGGSSTQDKASLAVVPSDNSQSIVIEYPDETEATPDLQSDDRSPSFKTAREFWRKKSSKPKVIKPSDSAADLKSASTKGKIAGNELGSDKKSSQKPKKAKGHSSPDADSCIGIRSPTPIGKKKKEYAKKLSLNVSRDVLPRDAYDAKVATIRTQVKLPARVENANKGKRPGRPIAISPPSVEGPSEYTVKEVAPFVTEHK